MVDALSKDKNRKFIIAEIAFFQRYWNETTVADRERVRWVFFFEK